jgi:hypothetical protein
VGGFEALARELIAITRAEKLGLTRWYAWKTP